MARRSIPWIRQPRVCRSALGNRGICFSLCPTQQQLQERVSTFVREKVIPFEADPRRTTHGPTEELRRDLVGLARDAGLLSGLPDMHEALRSHVTRAIVFEAAGYSMLGPIALNIAAPDEGNMHMLELIATPSQRKEFLEPMLAGETRSCFSMTEPPPGAGSDPTALRTVAKPDGEGGYVIDGEKWLITGAEGARFTIIMAQTLDASGAHTGASMFLAPMDDPAIRTVRVLDTMDSSFTGGARAPVLRGPAGGAGGGARGGRPGLQVRPSAPRARTPHTLHAMGK